MRRGDDNPATLVVYFAWRLKRRPEWGILRLPSVLRVTWAYCRIPAVIAIAINYRNQPSPIGRALAIRDIDINLALVFAGAVRLRSLKYFGVLFRAMSRQ